MSQAAKEEGSRGEKVGEKKGEVRSQSQMDPS